MSKLDLGVCSMRHSTQLVMNFEARRVKAISWNAANVARLREILMRSPTPMLPLVAAEMQVTVSSIKTAMSRHGLGKTGSGARTDYGVMTKRDCITCDAPFLSEGKHNRMCPNCRAETAWCAA